MIVTSTMIGLDYFISDITTALLSFNKLRWYRSRTGRSGVYEAMTSAAAAPATLTGAKEPHAVHGKMLSFKVNGVTTVNVTFSAANPVTTAQAVTAINGATGLVVASNAAGYLVLTTVATGTGASIEILASDAAPYLGFLTGDAALGTAADATLVSGTHQYFVTDLNGSVTDFYAVELRNSSTSEVAPLSVGFAATRPQGIPKTETVPCFVRLTDMTGYPLQGAEISIHNAFVPNQTTVANKMWTMFRHAITMVTDQDGYAETRLLKGAVIDVNIGGTGMTRRVTVPTTSDSVDLLDPALNTTDEFGIQEPDINFAIRSS